MVEQTRVDFYVLEATGESGRLVFACRLAEKAYKLDNEVYAHTGSQEVAAQLDEMLWTFRQGSFIPHEQLGDEPARSPVRIGSPGREQHSGGLLINLAGQVPTFAKQFTRIAEIVDADPDSRAQSRDRFRQYRDMGLEPVTHRI